MKQSSAEVRIEKLALRYFEIAAEKAALEREEANVRDQLEEWLLDNGEEAITLEGIGTVGWQDKRIRNFDVKAIFEQDQRLFNRLLDLNVLDVNKTRLDANQQFIGMKVPMQEGVQRSLVRERRK